MQDPRKHYILYNSTVRREEAQQEANVEEVVQIETATQSSRFVTLQSEDKLHRHICHMSVKYRQIRFQIPGLKTANISLTAAEIR